MGAGDAPGPVACTAIVPFAADGPAAQLQALADERMQARRTVDFPANSAIGRVELRQQPGKALGAVAWTAGVELACFAERRFAAQLAGGRLRVLELGSGTGLTAVALAKLGAHVTATDMFPELVVLARKNAQAAVPEPSRCQAVVYSWGQPLRGPLLDPFDLVLGSEITYVDEAHEPLVQTLCDLCRGRAEAPAVLIAETLRNPRMPEFWRRAGRHFAVKEVYAAAQHDSWNVRDTAAPVRIFELRWRGGEAAADAADVAGPTAPLAAVPPAAARAAQCPRVSSVDAAQAAVREHGACILTGLGTDVGEAEALPRRLFGQQLRAAPAPAEVSDRVLAGRGLLKEDHFRAHTDGHAYGDLFPDYFLLLCSRACREGGSNFLIDGYALLDALGEDPETAWLPSALESRAVDQTTRLPSVSPVLLRGPCGRRALRCRMPGPPAAFPPQRAAASSEDPEGDTAMLEAYHKAVQRAADAAPRVVLRPGEALLVDNYRMFHGRDPYTDPERLLWRVWLWTDGARGVPAGELCSTPGDRQGEVSRDASAAAAAVGAAAATSAAVAAASPAAATEAQGWWYCCLRRDA